MKKHRAKWFTLLLLVVFFGAGLSTLNLSSNASTTAKADLASSPIKHVVLISVDGLHAVDLARFIASHPNSTLAQLSNTGTTYTNAATSMPSDSFPGILALTTGGSPRSTGVYYDDSYDRLLSAPGSDCSVKGTEVVLDESIDKNQDALDAGGGIDPAKLPRDGSKGCTPVYPHSFLRVNTIFEVIKAAGGRTAWSDKHPAYDLVNGPSGVGVDDLYTPEINNASSPTDSVSATEAYDDIKVAAIINEINGFDHTGATKVGTPTILGMNFQAVSVGQKLKTGGYTDIFATPNNSLADAMNHTDQSLGKMVKALNDNGLMASTLFIVSAKHGQSPVDPALLKKIPAKTIPNIINQVKPGLVAQATEDDVALIWLTDQNYTEQAAYLLGWKGNEQAIGASKIYADDNLKLKFPDPRLDSRAPDIIVQPNLGVIYTGSSKIAEHGGFSPDDTNVALVVSNPSMSAKKVNTAVQTTQVAPTILKVLGLDPQALQAVQMEGTQLLPGWDK
jgi:predicted AlkP superfamily pyrophosphatase or phosphodiesterase